MCLTPRTGPASGGTNVTIFGNSFSNVVEVLFGNVPAASFEVVSSNRINAVVPQHEAGNVDVRVSTVAGGTSEPDKVDQFTFAMVPMVTELKPSQGPTRGGTLIVVHGGNFVAGQTKVHFGQRQGKELKVLSDRMLLVKSPDGEAGTVPLVVRTQAGESAEAPFVYESPAPAAANSEGVDRQTWE
jgi:hypothetical protein